MSNQSEEPEWLEAGATIVSTIVLVGVFGLLLPLVFFTIFDWLDFRLISDRPFSVRLLLYVAASVLILKFVDKNWPVIWNVQAGCVQFIKCGLPGEEIVYKLDGGFHILVPIFIKWRHQWSYDEKWDISINKYRVSLKGTSDVIATAVATCYPLKDSLLPLHLIGNDTKDSNVEVCTNMRREFVVRNVQAQLRKLIETEISNRREKCVKEGTKRIDSAVDVIEKSDKVEKSIWKKIKQSADDLAKRFGVEIDSFSLDDIDFPKVVADQRDNAAGYEILEETAARIAKRSENDGIEGQISLQEAIRMGQLQDQNNEKVTETITVSKKGIESDTLKAIVDLVSPFAVILKGHLDSKQQPTGQQSPP